jgi:hypothetical protein
MAAFLLVAMPRAVAADPVVIASGTIAAERPVSLASAEVRVEAIRLS